MRALYQALLVVIGLALVSTIPSSVEAKRGSRSMWAAAEKVRVCGRDHSECHNAFVWTRDGLYLVPHDMTMEQIYLRAGDEIAKQGSPRWYVLGLFWLIASYYWYIIAGLAALVLWMLRRRPRELQSGRPRVY